MNGDEQNIEIRNKLLNLPKAKAGADFENELLRRINTLEAEEKKPEVKKTGFLDFIFGRKTLVWAVPAGSLAVIFLVILVIYRSGGFDSTQSMQDRKTTETSGEVKSPDNRQSAKNEIPGKDIANDLETGKNTALQTERTLQKGYNESAPSPKTEQSKTETGTNKSAIKEVHEDVKIMETQKTELPKERELKGVEPVKPEDKKATDEVKQKVEEGKDVPKNVEKAEDKNDKNTGIDKNLVSPMIKDSEKKKTGKDSTKKDESKKNTKDLSKELLEELKKKIKDN